VPPARATTTTTLPPCTAESCADDDPCTDDRCTPSGCVHEALEGFDALRCVVDAALAPPTCTDVPPRVQRHLDRARGLITRAASAPSAKSARLVKRAAGALNQAAVAAGRAAKRNRITLECANALRGALLSRAERLAAAR
jgi:hypothetical protein